MGFNIITTIGKKKSRYLKQLSNTFSHRFPVFPGYISCDPSDHMDSSLKETNRSDIHYAASKEIELAFVIAPITSTAFIYHSFEL